MDVPVPVEHDSVLTYPKPIAVGPINQPLDINCIGHALKRRHRIAYLLLMIGMQPKQLFDGFTRPVDRIYLRLISLL
ncbi:hypothetical protein C4J94_4042 [Pseudomonas sp. R5-89-07]|nr:hypothetical protein C4J94_4042 [Pseudomonas sp. R5-89-07]